MHSHKNEIILVLETEFSLRREKENEAEVPGAVTAFQGNLRDLVKAGA